MLSCDSTPPRSGATLASRPSGERRSTPQYPHTGRVPRRVRTLGLPSAAPRAAQTGTSGTRQERSDRDRDDRHLADPGGTRPTQGRARAPEGEGRTEITDRIAAARDEGDLKENGGYHAAREEQAKHEARIRELKEKLRNVQIGTPPDDGVVEPGMVVTALVAGDEMVFLLGSREIAGTTDIDVYSPTSPLGAAIIGQDRRHDHVHRAQRP